ncbi:MAG: hypothetical protein PHH38_08315 [Candidatus Cloacimonetes bacterium]|nr:hypothetical protein [Candidatus Cloacimonadota bacterium]
MNSFRYYLRCLLKAMCSEYNGIQVFLYPGTIFYWLSGSGLVWSFTSLLSMRIHFLPLVFFTVLFAYVCFMVLKIYTGVFVGPHKLQMERLSYFFELVIGLHYALFVAIIILMVFYVLSKFLAYYYGIELPIKEAIWFVFRAFTIILILYHYLKTIWIRPLQKASINIKRSERYCLAWIARYPWAAIKFTGIATILMLAAVRLYLIVIVLFLSPTLVYLQGITGLKLNIELLPVTGMASVFYNVFMLFAAFMLSNLIFYPIILLSNTLSERMNPISFKQVQHAQG